MTGFSTLRSFSLSTTDIPCKVLGLFEKMDEVTEELDCTMEIIEAALEGYIDFEKEFNLAGYVYRIHQKHRLWENNKRKKYIHIINSEDSDEAGDGGVCLSHLVSEENTYEEIEQKAEVKYYVKKLYSIRQEFLIDEGIDLIPLLKNAVACVPQAVNTLKKLCEEFDYISEIVMVLLGSGESIDVLLKEV